MSYYLFGKDGGGEQNYSIVEDTDMVELQSMVTLAFADGVKLVAIMDAESSVVMITSERIAKVLLPTLNVEGKRIHPLEALNYTDNKIPEDVLEVARERGEL